ncbi:MAG: hypothetical protein OXE02_11115 [Chloroflexi bacterium]|nr:hypothetical protein [Chloroflexota bacterium]
MTDSDRTETIRTITFEGKFTVREEVRPSVGKDNLADAHQPQRRKRPILGFRTASPQPLPEPPLDESPDSDTCSLNETCRRHNVLL